MTIPTYFFLFNKLKYNFVRLRRCNCILDDSVQLIYTHIYGFDKVSILHDLFRREGFQIEEIVKISRT